MHPRRSDSGLDCWQSEWFAVNLYFDVVVHFVRGISLAVEADIAALGSLAVGNHPEPGFSIRAVRAFAHVGGVVEIVVVNRGHAILELRIIGNLDDHIVVGPHLGMEVPNPDAIDLGAFLKIDLHPLGAVHQLDEVTFSSVLLTIGDEIERTDDRIRIAAGDLLLQVNLVFLLFLLSL